MEINLGENNARALLQSVQRQRVHWGDAITSHLGFSVTVNTAIWSYFLKSYIDSLGSNSSNGLSYLIIACALSSILLGLWRLYTHYIDNHIAGLYPDFVLFEGVMSLPSELGTSGYLSRENPRLAHILEGEKYPLGKKVEILREIVKSKQIGKRGHGGIDIFVFIALLIMTILAVVTTYKTPSFLNALCLLGVLGGHFFFYWGAFLYQRKSRKKCLKRILDKFSTP
ncbi:MAG: hypothetical protein ACFFCW_24805 [Candidatus Hodarchaeota archaeon]